MNDGMIKEQIEKLAAETLALQAVLAQLARELSRLNPELGNAVSRAFDHVAVGLSFYDADMLHMPRSLKVIKELRTVVFGKGEPKHGV